ncbi:LytR/AlgR family response regulator transcription factor [Flavobacterium kingsejongi]|uniref:DNA-binding response regulator n=1 Tax=Flavobacterium kingsejongi TaxID=1678728 RepID=A0A2S1LKN8_9FLAO|nr:LytTR family transcriptional regulator DNA-binding domain-containing protein [Flavobacterium kingsejongi]AWG24288.1 DNA-binding response regulator [Flavobacterium kingsejongi]
MKYPYVIIDDDLESTSEIKLELDNFSDFFLVGTSDNYEKGLNLILETHPILVFLEIDPLEEQSQLSFKLIHELTQYLKILPRIIVVTKGRQHAYEAIKHNVFDYLVKPLRTQDMRKALLRFEYAVENTASEIHNFGITNKNSQFLREVKNQTICLKSYGDYRFVDTEDIVYLQADNNSTDLFINNGDTITAFKTLKHFENTLPAQFVRIHNSYVINMNYVSRIHLGNSACYIKNSKIKLPFSKSYKKNIDLIISVIPTADIKEI